MNEKSYSVVIRTLGTAGEKYEKLLNSIAIQTIQPLEIIVVLPYGYKVNYSLGRERFIFSEKGMTHQRAAGIENATTKYILVLDDDICFNECFVENIFNVINKTNADVVVPYYNTVGQNKSIVENIILNLKYIFIGQRFLLLPNSKYRVKYASTGGHLINLNICDDKLYLTQSWNGACFFMKTDMAKNVKIGDETWLKKAGYEIFEDMVFSYKAFKLGCKSIFAPHIHYVHLDGGAGHKKDMDNVSRLKRKLYGNTLNRSIYWQKFLFSPANRIKKIWLLGCQLYATINTFLLYFVYCIPKPSYWKVPFSVWKGARDALRYCKQEKTEREK